MEHMRVPENQPFVPVILGGDIGTYSLAREFHEAYGFVSVVVPAASNGVLDYSVATVVRPAGTMTEADVVVRHLQEIARDLSPNGERKLLLFGSLDLQVTLITRHREQLSDHFVIPYVDIDTMERAALKENFYELCAELGVPHPTTLAVDMVEHAEGKPLPKNLPYPLIGKPADSSAWVHAKFEGKKKIHTITDEGDLLSLLGRIAGSGYRQKFIVQEYVPGGDDHMRLCTFWADRPGHVTFASYGEVVVEEHSPIVLGNSAGIVTGVNEEVINHGVRLLEALNWEGFGMIDAKLDPRDGQVKFFELNPRLGRNHYYVTATGHNVARFYVRRYLGEEYDAANAVSTENGSYQRVGDVDAANAELLYTVLPMPLLRKHLRGPVGEKAKRMISAKRVVNPLIYKAEKHPRRWAYVAMNAVNQVRKFRQFPPRTS
ncbi:carboxylate--amine ligase [Neomicrococcus lactis]